MLVLNSRKMLFQPPVPGVCVDGGLFIHQIQLTTCSMLSIVGSARFSNVEVRHSYCLPRIHCPGWETNHKKIIIHHLPLDYKRYEGKTWSHSGGERGESGGFIWASVRGGGQEDFPEQVTTEYYRVSRC